VAPGLAFVFNTALNPEGGLNFSMRDGVAAGEQSRLMFLHTDATAYARTAEFDVLSTGPGYHSPFYSTFAPVPEPSVVLMTIGRVGLGPDAAPPAWSTRPTPGLIGPLRPFDGATRPSR
jgi:hypothetical protein